MRDDLDVLVRLPPANPTAVSAGTRPRASPKVKRCHAGSQRHSLTEWRAGGERPVDGSGGGAGLVGQRHDHRIVTIQSGSSSSCATSGGSQQEISSLSSLADVP
jgi:hypothetical protein